MSELKVAAIQTQSTDDVEKNLEQVMKLSRRAVEGGAHFLALPENYAFLGSEVDKRSLAKPLDGHPFLLPLQALAREAGVTVLAGSVPEAGSDPDRPYNTSVMIGPDGAVTSSYRKIHLFDIDIPDGVTYCESAAVTPGESTVLTTVGSFSVGLSVCYDLRFPELYRELVTQGADVLTVPAAFTLQTGKDHWDALLRARAIENQAYVIAPNQWGSHGRGRASWGKTQIIDPWGTVLGLVGEEPGLCFARMSGDFLRRCRQNLPALTHRRITS
jgi:predicted amidohydrolase